VSPTAVTNDPQAVRRLVGLDSWRHSLPPKLGIDQFRTMLPVVVEREGGPPAIVAKEIDRTNLEAVDGLAAELVFHSPYFTFDAVEAPRDDVHATVADAVAACASDAPVLDRSMSVSLHAELGAALGLPEDAAHARDPGFPAELNHYVVPRSAVPRRTASRRDVATQAAWPYADALGCREAIAPWLSAPMDDPLSSLDALMAQHDVDAVLCCTPLTMQELTGVPAALFAAEDFALYARGERDVHVLSVRELPWLGLPDVSAATSASLLALAGGARVGFEELNLPRRAFDAFGLDRAATVPASRLLRRWREQRSWVDLAFALVGTQVTLAGIEAALSLVSDALEAKRPVTELDAYGRYAEVVRTEIERRNLPIRVRTYFTHTHAGNRSGIPASATSHSLVPLTSLKIDAGLEIYDDTGFHRATSDVTRSVVGSARAREAYDLFERALVDGAIPACRPGATGADVFAAGIGQLEPHRAALGAAGLCPPAGAGGLHELVGRDIGHLLGKQEPATTVFEKGNGFQLEPGMVAAAEFQWPYRQWCLGVEDVFLVTDGEPINLTRPVGR
jgi:Xaa-Pro aminopeptidase